MSLGDRALNVGQLAQRLEVAVYPICFLPVHNHNISVSSGLCNKICGLLLGTCATDHRERKPLIW